MEIEKFIRKKFDDFNDYFYEDVLQLYDEETLESAISDALSNESPEQDKNGKFLSWKEYLTSKVYEVEIENKNGGGTTTIVTDSKQEAIDMADKVFKTINKKSQRVNVNSYSFKSEYIECVYMLEE